eukprot:4062427-Prymnesium_polylepis.1
MRSWRSPRSAGASAQPGSWSGTRTGSLGRAIRSPAVANGVHIMRDKPAALVRWAGAGPANAEEYEPDSGTRAWRAQHPCACGFRLV